MITIFPLFVEPLWHPNLAIGFGTTKSPKLRFQRGLRVKLNFLIFPNVINHLI